MSLTSRAAAVLLTTAAIAAANPALAQFFLDDEPLFTETGTAGVIESDHIVVNDRVISLYGIDGPLRIQPCIQQGEKFACGDMARNALIGLAEGRTVTCTEVRDPHLRRRVQRWGRCVRDDGVDLAAEMVKLGMVTALADQSEEYVPLETTAKEGKVGLWGADEFQAPWEWELEMRTQ